MKKVLIVLALIFCAAYALAQDITGDWHGMLEEQGMKIRIVVHISGKADKLSATFDSPDQGAFGIPISSVTFADSQLNVVVDVPRITYTGTLKDGIIQGTFSQAGAEIPLNLQREEIKKPVMNRPQEPKKPFPYKVKNVKFKNKEAGIKLAGTLTLPAQKGPYPAVVLISGSGPQDRNEELLGHKPFLVLADYLTRNGIAVLRFDDRGVGASKGKFETATSFDFATDVKSAVKYLQKRKDIAKIGLIGHSEGGLIAPMVAADLPELGFIVLLAGPGIRGDKILLLQEELIWRADETDEEVIQKSLEVNKSIYAMITGGIPDVELAANIRPYLEKSIADSLVTIPEGYTAEDVITETISVMTSPWMLAFMRHEPAPVLEKVKCPVLALNGTKDLQVPCEINLEAISEALGKGNNQDFRTVSFEGLNHLFQECDTGHPSEYAAIEQTIAPRVLETIVAWIAEQTGTK